MAITKQVFSGFIKQFNFRELFNEMGWNNDKTVQPVTADDVTYSLQAVAEKSGFKILVCNPPATCIIPDYNTRKKIETKITKLFQEHLIIFIDDRKQEQIWQFVVRQSGKPTKVTETRFHISQDPELLYQRASGIFFELDEEENITIVDVTNRMAQNFHANSEKVTRLFYEKFKKEHTSFLTFIKGIDEKTNKEWYASLMLNRLMFCYFVQKKGFLDNNKNYLRDKLKACQDKKGKDKFYSFYRDFLLLLFHEGLNEAKQKAKVKIEIGNIPYLNGGLFDEHELEKLYKNNIDIEDKAFEGVFDFFDQYEWHLDTRINASGKDINPDVIGYIFEKYINDRADMGAYYTKEDITDYISKNCILPYLFDETKRHYPLAFKADGEVFQTVSQSGDKYIYDAVKKGIALTLPDEISIGINDVTRRSEWNKPAPEDFALPTEIWREVVDRRNRYNEVKNKIDNSEITGINDFITHNLNIRQFAQDIIENTNDSDFLRHLYKAISSVTILDPTCGSGAFLFAALNILEPLYEACIMRMRAFVEDEDRVNEVEKKSFSHKYKYFRSVLKETQNEHHPNLQYFIYKSIILRNLYGVDIMKEAVEIAKLRLFLKLVASVEVDHRKPNLGLEPLPDIDFNIKPGNSLIGFATDKELKNALDYTFDGPALKKDILEKCDVVKMAFERYKEIQLNNSSRDYFDFKNAKENLDKKLKDLNHSANILLSRPYGSNPTSEEEKSRENLIINNKGFSNDYITPNSQYAKFLKSHQPFHWFAEFYEIINDKGGFDCVIGNPPYVEYSSVRKLYTLKDFKCISSSNLYAFVIERAINIQKNGSYNGMIIPLSAYCTDRMAAFQKVEYNNCSELLLSFYAERPSKLFEGAERNLVISIFKKEENKKVEKIFTTYYYKWNASFRDYLFENISYAEAKSTITNGIVPKISVKEEVSLIASLRKAKKTISYYTSKQRTNHVLYYRNSGGRYWKIITNFQPNFYLNGKKDVSSRESYLHFNDASTLKIAISVLNSTLYYWYYVMHSDARTNNPSDLRDFPIDINTFSQLTKEKLCDSCDKLMQDIQSNAIMQPAKYKTGNVEFQQFFPQKSKPIIDEIDTVLAAHYGFTPEELDFIINYDIKYRMGKELEDDE